MDYRAGDDENILFDTCSNEISYVGLLDTPKNVQGVETPLAHKKNGLCCC